MFGRIHQWSQWSQMVLGCSVLGGFRFLIQSPHYYCVQTFKFLTDSGLVGRMSPGTYPFSLGYPIWRHVIVQLSLRVLLIVVTQEIHRIRLFIWDLSIIVIYAFITINFPFRAASAASHRFGNVGFLFSFQEFLKISLHFFSDPGLTLQECVI